MKRTIYTILAALIATIMLCLCLCLSGCTESEKASYVVEQKQYKGAEKYKYTLNFNPKMWIPVEADTID